MNWFELYDDLKWKLSFLKKYYPDVPNYITFMIENEKQLFVFAYKESDFKKTSKKFKNAFYSYLKADNRDRDKKINFLIHKFAERKYLKLEKQENIKRYTFEEVLKKVYKFFATGNKEQKKEM